MTTRMIELANKLSDVLICDTTFKTNCLGMPLLNIICTNNWGKSYTVFVTLLSNSKYTNFNGSYQNSEKILK